MKHLWPVALLFAVLACERTEVRVIELTVAQSSRELDLFGLPKASFDSYAGFGCVDWPESDQGEGVHPLRMMVARAYDPPELVASEATLRASVVVDTIRLGGYPRCRATEILNFCAEHDCKPIESERRCFDLPAVVVPRAADLERRLNVFHGYLRDGLKNALVTSDAVDEEVILRLVGTTEKCEDLAKKADLALDPTKLLGCNYSCPIVPTAVRGEVLMDLDALTQSFCEPAVRACAAASFSLAPVEETSLPALCPVLCAGQCE